jgi:beta-lactamase regulating signal transducer with metallopeptidase domain
MKPNFSIFSDNLDYALGWMVIHSLWQATLIALISGVLMLFLRKKAAKIRYIVANVALMCVLVASAVTFCMYYDFSNDEGTMTFTPAIESGLIDVQNQVGTLAQPLVTLPTPNLNPQSSNLISVEGFKEYFNRNLPMILVFWVLGVALFMLRLLGGLSYIYYLKNRMNFPADEYWVDLIADLSDRAGLKKGVELVESAMVRTPMVLGHLKPMILFPMGVINRLSPEEVEAILAHELAHVLRNDYVFNILQSVVEALFYFHPAVWWMSAQISNERESACDDIAINLIKNKMNYARALVAIQEMAYFPMTPALAFAGQRKSQFMMRMQRILNQPNNKTNVMEKLSATCLLLFLMIGLSFGSNLKNDKSDISSNGGPSVFSALDTIPSNSMYSNVPQSGDYNYEDNTQKVKLKVDEGKVKQLIVNGLEVPEKDIPNFSNLTEKILRKATPPPPQTPTNSIFTPEAFENLKQEGGEIKIDNLAKILDLNKMGGADVNISESGDGDMIINGKNGSRTTIEHDDNGSQVIISTDKNGNVSKVVVDKNGKTVTENFSREGKLLSKTNITTNEDGGSTITSIESNGNKSNVNTNKNGKTSIESTQNGRVTNTFIDAGVITTIDDTGKKTVIEKDSEGHQTIKSYDPSGKFIEEIKVVGDKMYLNGKVMTEEEMKARGYLGNFNGKYLNRNGGFNNIKPQNSRTNNIVNDKRYNSDSHSDSEGGDDENNDLQSDIQEFKSDVKELRNDIKTCDCTENFDFRMGLMEELDRIFPAYKSQNRKVFNAFEKRFMDIKNRWDKSACKGNFVTDDAEKARQNASKLRQNAARQNLQESRNKAEMNREKAQAERDTRTAMEDRKTALEDAKQAKNDENDGDKGDIAKRSIFVNLKKLGLISVNKKCTLTMDKNHIEVDGKTLDNATFKRIYNEFERKLGEKATALSIYFKGVFNEISEGKVEMEGTSSSSLSTDD